MANTGGDTLLRRMGAVGTEDDGSVFDPLPASIDLQRGQCRATEGWAARVVMGVHRAPSRRIAGVLQHRQEDSAFVILFQKWKAALVSRVMAPSRLL